MKIRTIVAQVDNVTEDAIFWRQFLGVQPTTESSDWTEFQLGDIHLALMPRGDDATSPGSGYWTPVFSVTAGALDSAVNSAIGLGSKIVLDLREDPEVRSVVLESASGSQFEVSAFGTDG